MKRYWSGLVVASALAATAALGAQDAAQGPNPANTPPADRGAQPGQRPQPGPSSPGRTRSAVTVTGCIQNAPAATGAVPARAQAGQRFVLSNGRMASTGDASRSAVGTGGTSMTTYQLEGQTPEISTHLNHRVEITGTLQSSNASPTGSASAAAGATAVGPTLRVTSVKMLSSTCDEAATPGTSGSTTPGAAGTSGSSTPSQTAPTSPAEGNPASPEPKPEPNPEPQPRQEPPAPPQQQ